MDDLLDLIKSRRSVQKYLPKYVNWELVSRVLDAGRFAPSSGNLQNWKFIVIVDQELRNQVAEAALEQIWMASAPIHIIICAEPEKAERYYGIRGQRLYTIQNIAACTQNMLLEAHSLGLSTCWVGAFDEDRIKRLINAEESVRPQAIITLGYAERQPEKPPKYQIEGLTYFNSWRNKIRDPAKYLREYSIIWQRHIEKGKVFARETKEKLKEKVKEAKEELDKTF